ncbi:MAG: 23S rRNA (adenine(2503)-C(2))-methyltransferase RlmN [Flavobacteriales bacterium]|jgi:23S rRNA (adenine2503-C2)-methyltransferase|nr:23S rRNA (adenine(2503)-C(2))-methyltransferase RlmN [Flavobacteriales bacterium]MBT3964293.1 23S rRNA (adenine(2503)-C(2))-methyltransferase RlmN [Flavobacteriales bacterium]MBT4705573.1 23S rRNA (adenine(2503)-C(2))-methyltransferase RlmN [Flavobacteriales bacterium]MBT4931112.1 23S rRNA (adenine(2503)-C(2))-methyltransferase RlmN [Flavobacteriales bacterium]MBT5133480.1 23S rRNA (adenine(2503)-C(2))-methyltransferase RlmN [Flavobacteriales bacterium]
MSSPKRNIRSLSTEELIEFFKEINQPKFRASQVEQWLWQKHAKTFDLMTNLPVETRAALEEHFTVHAVEIAEEQVSSDGTIKCAFKLHEGKVVEGVLIPANDRMTACISSQVGCSLACKFCATGRLKRMRNLEPDEIFDQVVAIKDVARRHYDKPLTNIVYMGMGEPLLNYKNVVTSIDRISADFGLGMSPKRITLSTAGISKMIHRMGDEKVKFRLALSLHAANDEKRSKIMPINEQNSLDSLIDSMNHFYHATGNRVTYEYIIFKDFNDSIEDADELAAFVRKAPGRVNIIEYNPIDDGEFEQASPEKVDAFAAHLERKRVIVNIRRSRGKDIDAACGQLANKNEIATSAA